MIRIQLSENERNKLHRIRNTRDANLSERCLYILLSDEGKSVPEIAQIVKRNEHTIRFWLTAYQKGGINRLKGLTPSGRPARKSKIIYPIIQQVVPCSPIEYGYIEEGWTIGMIVDYLNKLGIEASESTVKRVLKKNGWIYKRFSKSMPEHAPTSDEKKARIEQIIKEIKDDQKDNEVEVFFVDESHFSNEPYVQRGWFLVGEKKKVPSTKKTEARTVIGALNLKTKKVYWKQAKRGTSKAFIEFLYQLRQSFPDKLIILILDNSSIHKSKRVKKFLESNPWIKLKLLTPYSPEYNPIERFWRWLKRKAYGSKSFQTIEQVMVRVRKIIWHYHEKWLVESINFNFKPYADIL